MIPLIEREIVKRQWMTKEDFMQMFAITQSLPGVFAVNISIFVGYRLKGFWGSLVCALGTILPSFAIILIIALFFNQFQDNPYVIRIFNGIRPTVVALILVPCLSAIKAIRMGYIDSPDHRNFVDMESRCIPGIYRIGGYCRRIGLYIMAKR